MNSPLIIICFYRGGVLTTSKEENEIEHQVKNHSVVPLTSIIIAIFFIAVGVHGCGISKFCSSTLLSVPGAQTCRCLTTETSTFSL